MTVNGLALIGVSRVEQLLQGKRKIRTPFLECTGRAAEGQLASVDIIRDSDEETGMDILAV